MPVQDCASGLDRFILIYRRAEGKSAKPQKAERGGGQDSCWDVQIHIRWVSDTCHVRAFQSSEKDITGQQPYPFQQKQYLKTQSTTSMEGGLGEVLEEIVQTQALRPLC